jgi:hypothetical protein
MQYISGKAWAYASRDPRQSPSFPYFKAKLEPTLVNPLQDFTQILCFRVPIY